jgi:hypothetical protein
LIEKQFHGNFELKTKIFQLLDILNIESLKKESLLELKEEATRELEEMIQNPKNTEGLMHILLNFRKELNYRRF